MTGTIKRMNIERGFGFITRDDGHGDVFFHAMQVNRSADNLLFAKLEMGMRLAFDVEDTPNGPRAFAIRKAH